MFKIRYRIRRDKGSGQWVPEYQRTIFGFHLAWSAYSYALLEGEPFEFDLLEEAIKCLEKETGKPRNRLDIQYIGL